MLHDNGIPQLIVEAKCKWISHDSVKELTQLLSYMQTYNISKGCLTNGNYWIFVDLNQKEMREIQLVNSETKKVDISCLQVVFDELNSKMNLENHSTLENTYPLTISAEEIPSGTCKKVYLTKVDQALLCERTMPNQTIPLLLTYKGGILWKTEFDVHNTHVTIGRRNSKSHIPNLGHYYIVTEEYYAEAIADNDSEKPVLPSVFLLMADQLYKKSSGQSIIDIHHSTQDWYRKTDLLRDASIKLEWNPDYIVNETKGWLNRKYTKPINISDDILSHDVTWHGGIALV